MKTLLPHTLLAHALRPGDKLLLAPNRLHRQNRNERLTDALHRRGLRFGLTPVPPEAAYYQRLHWVTNILTFKGFDLADAINGLLSDWRPAPARPDGPTPPTDTDIVQAVRVALVAANAPAEKIETLLRQIQEELGVYQHTTPTLILHVFGAAPTPHPSTLPVIEGQSRRMTVEEIAVPDAYRGIYLPAGSTSYIGLSAPTIAEMCAGPANCKSVWNADTNVPARLPLHEGVIAYPYPALRDPPYDEAYAADITAKAQDYADALRNHYTKGDVLVQYEPGDFSVTIWRIDRVGVGSWTPARPRGSRKAAPYTELATAMKPSDSVWFPPDYGVNKVTVGMGKAMWRVHEDVICSRTYPDGSVRIWRAPAYDDSTPTPPEARDPIIVPVNGYDIKVEAGIPIPPKRAGHNMQAASTPSQH